MITILHNPRCSTSRKVLEMIRETGTEPEIVEYLKHPLGRKDLVSTLIALEMGPRDVMRTSEPLYSELGLADPDMSDSALLDQLVAHPQLIERPIVVTAKGARLCRPAEKVLEIL
jgi:arsenate reductase